MKPHPETIELDQADLDSKLDQIATALGEDVARPFRQLLHWYVYLLTLLHEKKLSIQRLQKMLFGPATERAADILSSAGESTGESEPTSATPATAPKHPRRRTTRNRPSRTPRELVLRAAEGVGMAGFRHVSIPAARK